MEPPAKLIWPVTPPNPARAEALNVRETPPNSRVMRNVGGAKPDPSCAGVKMTFTWDALAPGVTKVSVSPAVKARAWSAVMVSKVYAVTLRPTTAASGNNGQTLSAREMQETTHNSVQDSPHKLREKTLMGIVSPGSHTLLSVAAAPQAMMSDPAIPALVMAVRTITWSASPSESESMNR